MESELPVVHNAPVHSLETIKVKLQEDPRNVDAAIAILAATDFFQNSDNPIHLKLFQFVTGIEIMTGQQRWPTKSLQHPNAKKVFFYDMKNLNVDSPVQIGFQLSIDNWFRLKPLLGPDYEPPTLEKERAKRQQKTVELQGVIIDAVKGKAIKFIFNASYHWAPRSLIKYSYEDETLTIPLWLAKKKELI
jgi:hypothetical protein